MVGEFLNRENLTLTDSTIWANSASQGGGIFNRNSTVSITNSTISANFASSNGGGINSALSTASITNSTIYSNFAGARGGGIVSFSGSGGIPSTINIANSTIWANSASFDGGGIFNYRSTASITNSTVSANSASFDGGGIYNSSYNNLSITTNINSTIVSGNNASDQGDEIYDLDGTVNADGNNLFGDSRKNNNGAFRNFTPGASDINATSDGTNTPLANILDPAGLQDNGGTTETIALVPKSPAIDAGNNNANLLTDQTGVARVINGQADIGAFESTFEIEVNTLVDENDGIDVGGISLREALDAIAPEGTITFSDSIANGTITLGGTELVIDKSVTIDGGDDNITVSGNNASRVFNIDDGTTAVQSVSISDLTITGGSTNNRGGGIYNFENLTLTDSTVSANFASSDGGGVFNDRSTASITNSTISANSSASRGGGVFNDRSTASITNSTISANFASSDSGGGFQRSFNGKYNK